MASLFSRTQNNTFTVKTEPLRPCWCRGRRALFHRWVNSAHPVLPRGVEPSENARYFQLRNTGGIVEFEDGTVARVWPSEIQFADGGAGLFEEYAWEPMVQQEREATREKD